MNVTKEMLVALALVLGVSFTHSACRCSECPQPPPCPSPDPPVVKDAAVADALSEAAPDAPELVWEPVVDLTWAEGLWGSKDAEEGWAEVSSKAKVEEDGGKWRYPYPWHLLVHPPGSQSTVDCGFHEERIGDAGLSAWRVAYCGGGILGEGRRHAKKLVLIRRETTVDFLTIDIEDVVYVTLDRN